MQHECSSGDKWFCPTCTGLSWCSLACGEGTSGTGLVIIRDLMKTNLETEWLWEWSSSESLLSILEARAIQASNSAHKSIEMSVKSYGKVQNRSPTSMKGHLCPHYLMPQENCSKNLWKVFIKRVRELQIADVLSHFAVAHIFALSVK